MLKMNDFNKCFVYIEFFFRLNALAKGKHNGNNIFKNPSFLNRMI